MLEISTIDVETVVRKVKSSPDFRVTDWHMKRATGGGGDAYNTGLLGIYRLWGTGHRQDGKQEEWSLFLKAFSSSSGSNDSTNLYYWRREEHVYNSELTKDRSTGICLPQLYECTHPSPNECWLWLEDIHDAFDNKWPLTHYAEVARHLGIWNAKYRAIKVSARFPWACGGLRETWLSMSEEPIANIDRYDQTGLLGKWLKHIGRQRLLTLWERRRHFQDILGNLPQILCHHDAFKRNLFARRVSDGRYETVAIDWAFTGVGAIAEDIATLIPVAVTFGEVPVKQLLQLDELGFKGYLEGLRLANWQIDEDIVRLSYTLSATVAHLVASCWFIIPGFAGGEFQRIIEGIQGVPIEAVYDRWVPVHDYLFDLAEEGQSLAKKLRFM